VTYRNRERTRTCLGCTPSCRAEAPRCVSGRRTAPGAGRAVAVCAVEVHLRPRRRRKSLSDGGPPPMDGPATTPNHKTAGGVCCVLGLGPGTGGDRFEAGQSQHHHHTKRHASNQEAHIPNGRVQSAVRLWSTRRPSLLVLTFVSIDKICIGSHHFVCSFDIQFRRPRRRTGSTSPTSWI
jgi:hypothetical protein